MQTGPDPWDVLVRKNCNLLKVGMVTGQTSLETRKPTRFIRLMSAEALDRDTVGDTKEIQNHVLNLLFNGLFSHANV